MKVNSVGSTYFIKPDLSIVYNRKYKRTSYERRKEITDMKEKKDLDVVLDINTLYGFLTELVSEEEKMDNFFKGLRYSNNNFVIMHRFLSKVTTLIGEDRNLDVIKCFDYNSKDKYYSSFRGVLFRVEKQTSSKNLEELFNLIMEERDMILQYVDEIKIDKKQKAILVQLKDYIDCI